MSPPVLRGAASVLGLGLALGCAADPGRTAMPTAPAVRTPDAGTPPPPAVRTPTPRAGTPQPRHTLERSAKPRRTRLHMTLNTLEPAQRAAAAKIGYNLFDLWEDAELINALPAGSKAMIWTGDATCDGFTQSIERFREIVRDLADNKKVFGYYLADEPEVSRCPEVGSQIKQRAEYIRRHAPGHKSFVATLDSEFSRLTPAKIGVDYFGIDPYPCRIGAGCAAGLIGRTVTKAAEAGIPRARMIPTFQTFGQDCSSGERAWRMPTPAELRRMLKEWDRALPDAPFDVSYTWGRQEGTSCPGLGDRPSLQEVMKEHIN